MSADVHTLAGAYALDALPDDERRFFERHLAECAECRSEVAELQETAARLGAAAYQTPPPHLKDTLLRQIDQTRQLPPLPAPANPRGWRERVAPALAIAAAVLAGAVLALGALTAHLGSRVQDLEREVAALGEETQLLPVLAAEDTQVAELAAVEGGGSARFLYSPSLDQGLLVTDGLEPLGPEEVYEIWTFLEGTPVPAGLFTTDQDGRALAAVEGTVADAEVLAVTVEARGGVAQPSGPIVLQTEL